MAPKKPAILFLPGSFAPPSMYDNLRDAVIARGLRFRALELPTVRLGPEDLRSPPSMYDDAAMLVSAVEELAAQDTDVIVIAHSYSGVPMAEGIAGLGKATRMSQGKNGGVVKAAYVTSAVPQVGQSAADVLSSKGGEPKVPFKLNEEGWFEQADIHKAARNVFMDLEPDEGLSWAQRFTQQSARSFKDPLTRAGYLDSDIAVSYLVCEKDSIITAESQRAGIKVMEEMSGKIVQVTSIEAGHVPIVRHVDEVTDWIVSLAALDPEKKM